MANPEDTIPGFLDALASERPTPGGGGAAAISGAMGAALVSMVCNLTIGKKKYAEVEAEMIATRDRAEALRAKLTGMVAEDVSAFDAVMGAYGLPKASDDDKAARAAAIQDALRLATDVPLACAKTCRAVIDLCEGIAERGDLNVVSDAGVAVLAAQAGLRSAALNVYVNAKAIEDRTFAEGRLADLARALDGADALTERVYGLVKSKLT